MLARLWRAIFQFIRTPPTRTAGPWAKRAYRRTASDPGLMPWTGVATSELIRYVRRLPPESFRVSSAFQPGFVGCEPREGEPPLVILGLCPLIFWPCRRAATAHELIHLGRHITRTTALRPHDEQYSDGFVAIEELKVWIMTFRFAWLSATILVTLYLAAFAGLPFYLAKLVGA
jgi:hypothetical protein